jgi:hypothetical protein
MRRRRFLTTTGAAGAALAGGVFGILKYPRSARAAGWGAWPADKMDAILPAERMATNVLELHINGGMSAFDTFYTVPTWGVADYQYVNQFAPGAPVDPAYERDARFESCGYGNAPADLWETSEILDANGVELFLGPWLLPLRARPDILSRMRIMVQRHDQVAHEGANPISFTGDRIGQPRLAGIGASIQRYFSENPEAPGGGGLRAAPYAYVLYPGAGFSTFNSLSASSVGFHPGSSRPLGVTVDQNSLLNELLARPGLTNPEQFDAAITYYRQVYENRFRAGGLGSPTRSPERGNYEFSDFARRNAAHLQDILPASLFEQIDSAPSACGDTQQAFDMSRMQARLAASLLTREEDQARYVLWIDTGIRPAQNGGHDTHFDHTEVSSQNIPNTMAALAEIIGDGPGQVNLDDTMIVINTEFGRTPGRQDDVGGSGTNHWPWGYVNIVIGGPIQERGIFGAIEEDTGYAEPPNYITPAENRILVMQSLGIYPFSSQSFAVGDVRGGVTDELQAATRVRDVYLGVTP